MSTLTLLQINQLGTPGDKTPPLPEAAQQVCRSTAALYARAGFVPPWTGYLARLGDDIVGACAFKSPVANGQVEIAYYTFPPHEDSGVATTMARQLLMIARKAMPDIAVTAMTEPRSNASNAILQKLGFRYTGTVHDPEDGAIWSWRLHSHHSIHCV